MVAGPDMLNATQPGKLIGSTSNRPFLNLARTRTRVPTSPRAFVGESTTCGVLSRRVSGGDRNADPRAGAFNWPDRAGHRTSVGCRRRPPRRFLKGTWTRSPLRLPCRCASESGIRTSAHRESQGWDRRRAHKRDSTRGRHKVCPEGNPSRAAGGASPSAGPARPGLSPLSEGRRFRILHEAPVDTRQQRACQAHSLLSAPERREAHDGPQLPRESVLPSRDVECLIEAFLGRALVALGAHRRNGFSSRPGVGLSTVRPLPLLCSGRPTRGRDQYVLGNHRALRRSSVRHVRSTTEYFEFLICRFCIGTCWVRDQNGDGELIRRPDDQQTSGLTVPGPLDLRRTARRRRCDASDRSDSAPGLRRRTEGKRPDRSKRDGPSRGSHIRPIPRATLTPPSSIGKDTPPA